MSIIIKGMEMPKSCGNCFFDTRCDNWRLRNWGAPPPDDCPLVPFPPHGDLIDRDPFIEFIKTHWDSYDQWFVEQLEARPTIIPAEEGKT